MRTFVAVALLLACSCYPAAAQDNASPEDFSVGTWTLQVSQLSTGTPELNSTAPARRLIGVFTPAKSLTITRVEALSDYGPALVANLRSKPVACPVPFVLEVSTSTGSHQVSLSSQFLDSNSSRTYTDSAPIAVKVDAGSQVRLYAVVPSATGYPPVGCICSGLQITVQYKTAR